jgi:hypothetical protein
MTTSSPSLGERYAGIAVLAGLARPGRVMPSIVTIIASWRVTVCPILASLSQTLTQSLSMRTCIG